MDDIHQRASSATLTKAISMSILYMKMQKIISEFVASTCTIITRINSKAKKLNIRIVSQGPDNLTTHSYCGIGFIKPMQL